MKGGDEAHVKGAGCCEAGRGRRAGTKARRALVAGGAGRGGEPRGVHWGRGWQPRGSVGPGGAPRALSSPGGLAA